ncbi:MAG: tetratricopeptide repeat protein [Candidatus Obscuribacterales bacterium]|nr:tetratricopeptide repeat protein [Candidatus Obscuribacterales bacterium]
MNESSNRATCCPFTSFVFPTDNLIATTEFAAAYSSQTEGRFSDATTRYKAVLKQLPECFEAYYNLGLCLREQEHLAEALSAFENTARLHPLFKMVYKDLADLYTKVGQASNAEAAIAAYSQL